MADDRQKRVVPRIRSLHVKNYRVLHDVKLTKLTPLTVFLGPNGSGKSTILDVLSFLSESFSTRLRDVWDKRGRLKELRTRNSQDSIEIKLRFVDTESRLVSYKLRLNQNKQRPVVESEDFAMIIRRKLFPLLAYNKGSGMFFTVAELNNMIEKGQSSSLSKDDIFNKMFKKDLIADDTLAINTFGQLADHKIVSEFFKFVCDLQIFDFNAAKTSGAIDNPEHLMSSFDNLTSVIQYLKENHPEVLGKILKALTRSVPKLESVDTELDGNQLLLKLKDAPFAEPFLAKYVSEGTRKLLAYLTLLHDPEPYPLIGIEEPENHLNPRLLGDLAEQCRMASANTQIFVTTHSPYFVNALRPEEVWYLDRDEHGYTRARRTADIPFIKELIAEGAVLGDLWMEGHFDDYRG